MPAFHKNVDGREGYKIQDLSAKNNFRVALQLPSGTSERNIFIYGLRAAGEECAARGFQFFDFGELDRMNYEIFCFTDSIHQSLAITFDSKGLAESPRHFIIEFLNMKENTQLQADDEVLLIGGKKPESMANVKSIVFQAALNKQTTMPVKINRHGRELVVIEPLVDLKNGLEGPDDLKLLRKHVP